MTLEKSSCSPNGEGSFGADDVLPSTVEFESLRRYASAKLSIAHQLRSLLNLLKKRGDETRCAPWTYRDEIQ
jgi:hypothetical protein